SCDLVTAPTFWASTVPFLNRISVGMPRILNFGGVAGLSSMLSLAIRILSLYWSAISSRMGAIILQGPHHSAQKSSNTGFSDLSTSLSNVASLVWTILGLLTGEIPPFGDSFEVFLRGSVWGKQFSYLREVTMRCRSGTIQRL